MINNNFIKKNTNFITSISAENLVYLEKTEQQNLSKTYQDEESQINSQLIIEAINLINQYILYGHTYIKSLSSHKNPIFPKTSNKQQTFNLNGYLGYNFINLQSLEIDLKNKYSNKIGYQFNHISDINHINLILNLINKYHNFSIATDDKIKNYHTLLQADIFENFLLKKYPLAKFFLGKGLESSNIILQTIIDSFQSQGIQSLYIAMAHRNRLNLVHNVLQKPFSSLFNELKDEEIIIDKMGDVKYHQGYKTTLNNLNIELLPNPSHLESVNTVLLGYLTANQQTNTNARGIIFHGDSSFSTLGAVQESLSLNNLAGYNYNGVIHIILNNRLGFTAKINKEYKDPTHAAKIADSLILNVSANDIDEIQKATLLALEYNEITKRDVFINLVGYRKLGHNEGDEPRYTSPLYYHQTDKEDSYFNQYTNHLINSNILKPKTKLQDINNFTNILEESFQNNLPIEQKKETQQKNTQKISKNISTVLDSINQQNFSNLLNKIYHFPTNFNINLKLQEILHKRLTTAKTENLIDYTLAESLAFSFLLLNNQNVRLSGEDSQRGTFSNRHSVLIDKETEKEYIPLNNLSNTQGLFTPLNSPISEYGVLGYEFGYSLLTTKNKDLVIWEAQFGDFLNNAQVIVDNYISSSYEKWGKSSNLVIYLPHGLEGQGHEHSSSRLERLLQLASENNFKIINPTTSHNLFYSLIEQSFANTPLFILTPKSYLRNPNLFSNIKDFFNIKHFIPIHSYLQDSQDKITNVIICHGKFSFILKDYIKTNSLSNYAVLTLDKIYPFPKKEFLTTIASYKNLSTIIVAQEEPSNMGILSYLNKELKNLAIATKINCKNIAFIGRKETSAIATYSQKTHQYEEKELLNQIFQKVN
jgi:2-oxoglutarate dehydrogenase E1 component